MKHKLFSKIGVDWKYCNQIQSYSEGTLCDSLAHLL